MQGSFSGAVVVDSLPFAVTLHVTNLSHSLTLTNGAADMVPSAFVYLRDSGMHESLTPASLPPSASDSATWQLIATPFLTLNTPASRYFAFVRANGSAPLIVTNKVLVLTKPFHERLRAEILDSLTLAPVPNAEVFFDYMSGHAIPTLWSDSSGNISPVFTQPGFYDLIVFKENYTTKLISLYAPSEGDTFPPILLAPAPVIGTFSRSTGLDPSMGITKFFFPDSLIGYAISRNVIWRTFDSGAQASDHAWRNAVFVSPNNNDLWDIRFANVRSGVVVGDSGEVLVTSDSGNTWTEESSLTSQNLHAVAFSDRDTAWAVGAGDHAWRERFSNAQVVHGLLWTSMSVCR